MASAVVTLGNVFAPSEIDACDNVQIVSSASHGPLLKRAAVMISHYGHGSVLKALNAGVPLLCMPIARAIRHGRAVSLPFLSRAKSAHTTA